MPEHLYTHEPISRTFYSQRLRLHYVEWVNEDASPLIMVHGGSDHCRNWDYLARELNDKFNIVAPDLRGHGDSEWSNNSYRKLDFVYDLKQLIAAKGYKKVSIVSHSLGSWISLLYAGLNPEMVEKMVIIEGLLPARPAHKARLENPRPQRLNDWMDVVYGISSFTPRSLPSFEEALERLHAANTSLSLEQARHLTVHAIRQNEDGTYSWKFDPYMRSLSDSPELLESEVIEVRRAIDCPILLLQGEESPFFMESDNEYIQSLQRCEVVNFPNTGHWPHHEQTGRVLEEIDAFFSN